MRIVPLVLGIVSLTLAWCSPALQFASTAFFAHMSVHMTVVAVAAPLIAAGISGSRWDPVRHVPWLFPPILASLLELGVVWLWHTPVLHTAARQNTAALVAEQGTFLLSGLVLWMAALGGDATFRGTRGASGIVALLLTAMHMTLLGALLALAPRSLYEHRHGYSGLSALEDQHLGGAIMLIVGGLSYLAGGLWLSFELLRRADIPRRSAIEA
jgi:putative membrane protein